ncbi:MAG: FtsQ-type POTRA domain-containing protein, partial [bacterium]
MRKAIGFLVFVEVLLLGGHAVRWARTSPLFAMEEVVLTGYRTLAPEEIIRLSALSSGMNLFEADLEGVRGRIEAHPWVRRARVRRRLPHAVHVEIEERLPVALIGGGAAVDREGVILGPAPRSGACLPRLEGYEKAGARPGEALGGPDAAAGLAAAVLFAGAPVLRSECFSVDRPRGGRLRLRGMGGALELLVSEAGMADQAARFRSVARRILRDQASRSAGPIELDLTFPGR